MGGVPSKITLSIPNLKLTKKIPRGIVTQWLFFNSIFSFLITIFIVMAPVQQYYSIYNINFVRPEKKAVQFTRRYSLGYLFVHSLRQSSLSQAIEDGKGNFMPYRVH